MKTCVAIRHVAFEDLGSFEPVLRESGFDVAYREAGWDELDAVDPLAPDLMVVLGGPIGAYEDESYPFLADELKLIEARLKAALACSARSPGACVLSHSIRAVVIARERQARRAAGAGAGCPEGVAALFAEVGAAGLGPAAAGVAAPAPPSPIARLCSLEALDLKALAREATACGLLEADVLA